MDGGKRREAESAADFLKARCVTMLMNKVGEVVEDFSLAFR